MLKLSFNLSMVASFGFVFYQEFFVNKEKLLGICLTHVEIHVKLTKRIETR